MVHVIILAGGKGTRMKSDMPKVLHPVKGTPIIQRLLSEVTKVCAKPTIIVGHKAEDVKAILGSHYHFVLQPELLGTGHAVKCAQKDLEQNKDIKTIVVLLGDHPLVSAETVKDLVQTHEQEQATITLATAQLPNYEGTNSVFLNYGRVIRGEDSTVHKIIEYKDATDAERAILEVNPSYYCFDAKWLWENISKISDHNAAKEYYLTDIVQLAHDQHKKVVASVIKNINECLGINTLEQLKIIEEALEE